MKQLELQLTPSAAALAQMPPTERGRALEQIVERWCSAGPSRHQPRPSRRRAPRR